MKIIILGAGQVGGTLAENLVRENHDITIVDRDTKRVQELQQRLDVRAISGHASHPDVLANAGADSADMVIAVTNSDETNMIGCQVSYSIFNVPTRIARIRSNSYIAYPKLFARQEMPVDVIISPEQLVTDYMMRLIEFPGALQVLDFANGRIQLVAVRPYTAETSKGYTINELHEQLHGVQMRVVAIFRHNHSIAITGSTVLEASDEVFFIAAPVHIRKILKALGRLDNPYSRIMIAGGGNIGMRLAQTLEPHYQVKVIEHNSDRTQALAHELHSSVVLHGDASDRELLINENIEYTDVYCAVTNDDEANIMSCLQAKRLGARQTMAIINRGAYVDLIQGGMIDIAISPQQATIGSILTLLRRGDMVRVHSLRRGAAEAIEVIAHGDLDTSRVVGRSIKEIRFPQGVVIGAIVRGDDAHIAQGDFIIESEDHVVMFVTNKKSIREIEKLFQVNVKFFG